MVKIPDQLEDRAQVDGLPFPQALFTPSLLGELDPRGCFSDEHRWISPQALWIRVGVRQSKGEPVRARVRHNVSSRSVDSRSAPTMMNEGRKEKSCEEKSWREGNSNGPISGLHGLS